MKGSAQPVSSKELQKWLRDFIVHWQLNTPHCSIEACLHIIQKSPPHTKVDSLAQSLKALKITAPITPSTEKKVMKWVYTHLDSSTLIEHKKTRQAFWNTLNSQANDLESLCGLTALFPELQVKKLHDWFCQFILSWQINKTLCSIDTSLNLLAPLNKEAAKTALDNVIKHLDTTHPQKPKNAQKIKKWSQTYLNLNLLMDNIRTRKAFWCHLIVHFKDIDMMTGFLSLFPGLLKENFIFKRNNLHFAAITLEPKIFQFFLEKGVDPYQKDFKNNSPLALVDRAKNRFKRELFFQKCIPMLFGITFPKLLNSTHIPSPIPDKTGIKQLRLKLVTALISDAPVQEVLDILRYWESIGPEVLNEKVNALYNTLGENVLFPLVRLAQNSPTEKQKNTAISFMALLIYYGISLDPLLKKVQFDSAFISKVKDAYKRTYQQQRLEHWQILEYKSQTINFRLLEQGLSKPLEYPPQIEKKFPLHHPWGIVFKSIQTSPDTLTFNPSLIKELALGYLFCDPSLKQFTLMLNDLHTIPKPLHLIPVYFIKEILLCHTEFPEPLLNTLDHHLKQLDIPPCLRLELIELSHHQHHQHRIHQRVINSYHQVLCLRKVKPLRKIKSTIDFSKSTKYIKEFTQALNAISRGWSVTIPTFQLSARLLDPIQAWVNQLIFSQKKENIVHMTNIFLAVAKNLNGVGASSQRNNLIAHMLYEILGASHIAPLLSHPKISHREWFINTSKSLASFAFKPDKISELKTNKGLPALPVTPPTPLFCLQSNIYGQHIQHFQRFIHQSEVEQLDYAASLNLFERRVNLKIPFTPEILQQYQHQSQAIQFKPKIDPRIQFPKLFQPPSIQQKEDSDLSEDLKKLSLSERPNSARTSRTSSTESLELDEQLNALSLHQGYLYNLSKQDKQLALQLEKNTTSQLEKQFIATLKQADPNAIQSLIKHITPDALNSFQTSPFIWILLFPMAPKQNKWFSQLLLKAKLNADQLTSILDNPQQLNRLFFLNAFCTLQSTILSMKTQLINDKEKLSQSINHILVSYGLTDYFFYPASTPQFHDTKLNEIWQIISQGTPYAYHPTKRCIHLFALNHLARGLLALGHQSLDLSPLLTQLPKLGRTEQILFFYFLKDFFLMDTTGNTLALQQKLITLFEQGQFNPDIPAPLFKAFNTIFHLTQTYSTLFQNEQALLKMILRPLKSKKPPSKRLYSKKIKVEAMGQRLNQMTRLFMQHATLPSTDTHSKSLMLPQTLEHLYATYIGLSRWVSYSILNTHSTKRAIEQAQYWVDVCLYFVNERPLSTSSSEPKTPSNPINLTMANAIITGFNRSEVSRLKLGPHLTHFEVFEEWKNRICTSRRNKELDQLLSDTSYYPNIEFFKTNISRANENNAHFGFRCLAKGELIQGFFNKLSLQPSTLSSHLKHMLSIYSMLQHFFQPPSARVESDLETLSYRLLFPEFRWDLSCYSLQALIKHIDLYWTCKTSTRFNSPLVLHIREKICLKSQNPTDRFWKKLRTHVLEILQDELYKSERKYLSTLDKKIKHWKKVDDPLQNIPPRSSSLLEKQNPKHHTWSRKSSTPW